MVDEEARVEGRERVEAKEERVVGRDETFDSPLSDEADESAVVPSKARALRDDRGKVLGPYQGRVPRAFTASCTSRELAQTIAAAAASMQWTLFPFAPGQMDWEAGKRLCTLL